ncbi:unnamed protein product [Adineta ricciae]|uniref:Uncharacterized protein n=2 Tax=Adineta ricciae TaxID=249248 RepID=A0A815XLY3_ADIRI|nr:unnamed protein product [Adineta ricciae]
MNFQVQLIGPTMPTIAINMNVSYSQMGSVVAARNFGYLIANLFVIIQHGAIKKYAYPILTVAFVLATIVMFSVPFVKIMVLMTGLFFLQGITYGLTDLCATHILLTMWNLYFAAPFSAARAGVGMGGVFVYLFIYPFLTKQAASHNDTNVSGINSTLTVVSATKSAQFNINIPYFITGGLCALIALGHLFFASREAKNKRERLEFKQSDYGTLTSNEGQDEEVPSPYSPRTFGYGDYRYGLTLCTIFICYIIAVGGNELGFPAFYFTFLKSDRFNVSNSEANLDNILFWLTNAASRIPVAILCVYVATSIILSVILTSGLCVGIIWLIVIWVVGATSTSLCILGAAAGAVLGALFPLSMAYISERMQVTHVALAYLYSSEAIGGVLFSKISGDVIDWDARHFITLYTVGITVNVILYFAAESVYFAHQRKTSFDKQTSVTNGVTLAPENVTEQEDK